MMPNDFASDFTAIYEYDILQTSFQIDRRSVRFAAQSVTWLPTTPDPPDQSPSLLVL
jgi:hypothetical protein